MQDVPIQRMAQNSPYFLRVCGSTAHNGGKRRMKLAPRVSCIIVNWNSWQDTVECLTSLRACTYPQLDIIVVDNGSTNDSVVRIKASCPDILLFESKENLGFSGGNNIGIRYALAMGAEYIWLLNSDTKPAP